MQGLTSFSSFGVAGSVLLSVALGCTSALADGAQDGELRFPVVADAAVFDGAPSTQYGTGNAMDFKGPAANATRELLFRFDLSDLPRERGTVTLSFVVGGGGNFSGNERIYLRLVDDWEWTDATAPAWGDFLGEQKGGSSSNAKGVFAAYGLSAADIVKDNVLSFDVTEGVRGALAGGATHMTMHVFMSDPDSVAWASIKAHEGGSGAALTFVPSQSSDVFPVIADTYVYDGKPATSFGTTTSMDVKDGNSSATREVLMRFDILSMPRTNGKVALTIPISNYGEASASACLVVREIADIPWFDLSAPCWSDVLGTQTGGTAADAPGVWAVEELGLTTAASPVRSVTIDVTAGMISAVDAGKTHLTLHVYLSDSAHTTWLALPSRDAGNGAYLTFVPAEDPNVFPALADAYVYDAQPQSRFGTAQKMDVKDGGTEGKSTRELLMRFDIRNVPQANGRVQVTIPISGYGNHDGDERLVVRALEDWNWSDACAPCWADVFGDRWGRTPVDAEGALTAKDLGLNSAEPVRSVTLDITAGVTAAVAAGKTTLTLHAYLDDPDHLTYLSAPSREAGNGAYLTFVPASDPNVFPAVADTYVYEKTPDERKGTEKGMDMKRGIGQTRELVVRFGLNGLAFDANHQKVVMTLPFSSCGNFTGGERVAVRRVEDWDWTDAVAPTWREFLGEQTGGTAADAEGVIAVVPFSPSQTAGRLNVNVTSGVLAALAEGKAFVTFHVYLVDANASAFVTFSPWERGAGPYLTCKDIKGMAITLR